MDRKLTNAINLSYRGLLSQLQHIYSQGGLDHHASYEALKGVVNHFILLI